MGKTNFVLCFKKLYTYLTICILLILFLSNICKTSLPGSTKPVFRKGHWNCFSPCPPFPLNYQLNSGEEDPFGSLGQKPISLYRDGSPFSTSLLEPYKNKTKQNKTYTTIFFQPQFGLNRGHFC